MNNFDAYIKEQVQLINAGLASYLPTAVAPGIREAMAYSLQAGGKRLRPLLTLAVAETFGAQGEDHLEVALAVEMIHTYSLIHDDLPCMDNSDLRRGKPTCHVAFDEALALLAGDGLLTLAFETVSIYGLKKGCSEKALKIVFELSRAAGLQGMIGGQVLDLAAENKQIVLKDLKILHALKTGALLKASARCGAIAAGVSSQELKLIDVYAENLGLAFQIVDDLLDLTGTTEELGKPAGSDQKLQKSTFPALIGKEASEKEAAKLYRAALYALGELSRPAELLEALAKKLVFRSS